MRLCIFEDDKFDLLYPLTHLRPTWELKCGHTQLYQKVLRQLGNDNCAFFARDHLTDVLRERHQAVPVNDMAALAGDDLLLVNGRWLFMRAALDAAGAEELGKAGDAVAYARVNRATAEKCRADSFDQFLANVGNELSHVNVDAQMIQYPWDIVVNLQDAIRDDFERLPERGIQGEFDSLARLYGDQSQVYIAPGAAVEAGAVLDAREGPIIVDRDTFIHPHSWVIGPVSIGEKTLVVGAKVREGCAIGPVCRVGGEVEESVMHAYVNKWHDGFLGHGYVCEFVNLGAATHNSDVKNDFGNVEVYVKGQLVKTGQWKVGCFIGDHTKTSIGTLFNTGSHIGIMCLILGGDGILPKFVPSLAWYINRKVTKGFGFQALVDGANGQMSKRDRHLTDADIALLKKVREITRPELVARAKRDRKL